jgi:hypothetical protein
MLHVQIDETSPDDVRKYKTERTQICAVPVRDNGFKYQFTICDKIPKFTFFSSGEHELYQRLIIKASLVNTMHELSLKQSNL